MAVLSYPFWRSRLGNDWQVIGKSITLDGLPMTVIGVMPQGFDYPKGTQVWRPLPSTMLPKGRDRRCGRCARCEYCGAVRPGISRRQLDADLERLTISSSQRIPARVRQRRIP